MSILTSGRNEPCKDGIGGLKEVWLSKFVQYDPAAIVGYRSALITSFPGTLMYNFEGQGKTFTETKDGEGWSQQITISFPKQSYTDTVNFLDVVALRVIAVVVDGTGKFRVAGLHNGLDAEVRSESGQGKGDFQGYIMTLSGLEPYPAPFISAFPGGGTPPITGFSKGGDYTLACFLAGSDLPASTSYIASSCEILE